MFVLITFLAVITLASVVAVFTDVKSDGYRRQPDRELLRIR